MKKIALGLLIAALLTAVGIIEPRETSADPLVISSGQVSFGFGQGPCERPSCGDIPPPPPVGIKVTLSKSVGGILVALFDTIGVIYPSNASDISTHSG